MKHKLLFGILSTSLLYACGVTGKAMRGSYLNDANGSDEPSLDAAAAKEDRTLAPQVESELTRNTEATAPVAAGPLAPKEEVPAVREPAPTNVLEKIIPPTQISGTFLAAYELSSETAPVAAVTVGLILYQDGLWASSFPNLYEPSFSAFVLTPTIISKPTITLKIQASTDKRFDQILTIHGNSVREMREGYGSIVVRASAIPNVPMYGGDFILQKALDDTRAIK